LRGLRSRMSRWQPMAAILTAEDVVRRIAAECGRAWRRRYPAEAGGGDRAAVWEQFRRAPRRKKARSAKSPRLL
jgi:hypothetical protein